MAEFVGNHALKLVTGELGQGAMGNHHHRLTGAVTGDKGVDAGFLIHHVQGRDGDAAGDRHFLDDVAQFALVGVAGIRVDFPGSDHLRHPFTTTGQVHPAHQRPATDQQHDSRGGQESMLAEQPVVEGLPGAFAAGDKLPDHAHRQGNQCDGHQEQGNQYRSVAPGTGLALEETGMSHESLLQKATLGAWRASGDSSSSWAVGLNASRPATMLLGNCSRKML